MEILVQNSKLKESEKWSTVIDFMTDDTFSIVDAQWIQILFWSLR